MTKEKFTYELIDNWLYLVGQQSVLMENYTQKDRTFVYADCSKRLERFFDYYDQVYEKVSPNQHSEEEIDTWLESLIQKLKNETIKNMIAEIENELCAKVGTPKEFIDQHLFHDEKGNHQEISNKTLVRFIAELRTEEERK